MQFLTVNKVLKQRLLGAIDSLKNERENIVTEKHTEDAHKKIDAAIKHAEHFANKHEFELGWNQFFIAEQELVKYMSEEQRIIKSNNLRIEASKITSWRQEQIYGLLGKPAKENEPQQHHISSAHKIIEVLKIKNDFYNTRNNKMLLKRAGMDSLARFLVGIIILIFACSFFVDFTSPPNLTWKIGLSILFGTLGATFSMAHSLASSGLENKIPEQLLSEYMIIIRLAIGASSAFIILMIYLSGFMDNLFSEVIIKSAYTYIVFSFLAGISERWVFNIISTITKDKEAAEKNK